MKILFLSDDFPPESFGGAGISTFELALAMKEAHHEVFVVTTCRKESDTGETEYQGLKVFKIASDYPERWRTYVSLCNVPVVRKLDEILKNIQPDVVHANNIHTYLSYHSLKTAKKYAKAVVITLRDTMAILHGKLETEAYLEHLNPRTNWRYHVKQTKKRWNPLRNFLIKKYLGYADQIFAISNSLREALKLNGIKNVSLIYNGIDLGEWQVEEKVQEVFRSKYHLHNKRVILFSGRLSSPKGGEKALEALALISKEIPNAVLLVAGTVDQYAHAMEERAQSLGVRERLIFTGWIGRDEIKNAYAVADIVLMPSIYLDAFGRVNMEAMASKKPVIGTRYGGTPEVVADGVTGYIVNPLHPEEIALKAVELLNDPEKSAAFGQAGYERVRDNFNLNDKVKEYLSVYKELLERKS